MASKPTIHPELLKEIIERCRQMGYDTGSLVN
jgi:lipocalin